MATSYEQQTGPTPEHEACVPLDRSQAALCALEVLLRVRDDEPLAALAAPLHRVFGQDQALILEEDGDDLLCTASMPDGAVGRRWPSDALPLGVTFAHVVDISRLDATRSVPADLVPPGHPALLIPIGLGQRRVTLMLRRAADRDDFGAPEVAFARQCAIVTLAALVARNDGGFSATIDDLRRAIAELRKAGDRTQRDLGFLKDVVDALPVGVTVQDDSGRFVLVNAVAAANLQTPATALIGASPADFLPAQEAAERRQWEAALIRSGQPASAEETVAGADGEHAWLATHTPAQISGRALLLSTAVDVTARKQIESKLAQRLYLDELTGLPSRALIEERVARAMDRGNARFALALLDLDSFKHVNDYFSHAVGDALLAKVAQRIQKHLRAGDMLARVSGDEFLLFIDPLESEAQVRSMIDGIALDLQEPFQVNSFEVFTSASFGVTVYPDHGATYEALRRNVDHAMDRAKSEHKSGAVYFDADMGANLAARMELEQRLRLAIRDGKFCCAFQPKVDIHTQEVIGFEALVRWRDEAGEIQPPGSFIGLAIELGLIDPITHFVLAESMRSIERLDAAFGSATTISVNIAAKQASDMNFMQSVVDALRHGRHADRIILELTEEAFVAKNQFQMQVLPVLRKLGVRVSIDDFGTGYSSLSVLADITADEVKVDRSFITDIHLRPRSQSVLRTIESLCHALGMSVIAEGVESFEELAYLQAASRIRYAQGYYFSKPFFLDELKDARLVASDIRSSGGARPHEPERGAGFGREAREARTG